MPALIFALVSLVAAAASADILYARDFLTGNLVRIDTDAATIDVIGAIPPMQSLVSPEPGVLYGADDDGEIYAIDLDTGAATATGVVFPNTQDFAARDGVVYAVTEDGHSYCDDPKFDDPPHILMVDLETGDAEEVVQLDPTAYEFCVQSLEGYRLSFDVDGAPFVTLFMHHFDGSTVSASLYSVDFDTGVLSDRVEVGYGSPGGYSLMQDLATRQAGGLWGSFLLDNDGDPFELFISQFDPAEFDLFDPESFEPLALNGETYWELLPLTSTPTACTADVNGDGALDVLDFVAFQQLFLAQDPAADCNGDKQFTILDFVCFQLLFQEGCG